MKDMKFISANGIQKEITVKPCFIQIVEEVNSVFCTNARSRVITNILDNNGKKITYLVRETPNEIYAALKEEGILLLNFTNVNGMHKSVFIKHSVVVKVEKYNSKYSTNAHSKIYTNLSDNNGKMFEYIAAETKGEIDSIIMQIQKSI